jgi:hypothetical protein
MPQYNIENAVEKNGLWALRTVLLLSNFIKLLLAASRQVKTCQPLLPLILAAQAVPSQPPAKIEWLRGLHVSIVI